MADTNNADETANKFTPGAAFAAGAVEKNPVNPVAQAERLNESEIFQKKNENSAKQGRGGSTTGTEENFAGGASALGEKGTRINCGVEQGQDCIDGVHHRRVYLIRSTSY